MQTVAATIEQYIRNQEIAGAMLRVRKRDAIVFDAAFGVSDIARQTPITGDTLFRLASMTKPIIAVAVMRFVEQGKLALDAPLSAYLPEFAALRVAERTISPEELTRADPENPLLAAERAARAVGSVPAKEPIRIRDLLTHSSGLGQGLVSQQAMSVLSSPEDSLAARVAKWAQVPLDFEPGTGTGYSAMAAFDTLALLVARLSGCDIEQALRAAIFEPLGMADCGFARYDAARLARLYEYDGARLLDVSDTDPGWQSMRATEHGYFSGGGGLVGSLNAYDRFVRMLRGGGALDGVRLLQAETVRTMAQSAARFAGPSAPGVRWGLGMAVFEDPAQANRGLGAGSFGWSGAFGTHFYIDPVNDLQFVLVLNRSNIGGADSYISKALEWAVLREFVG